MARILRELEYSVNVKEAGDYTMFASVATSNSTSGFSLSLDGKTLVENVALSGTSFDEFTKVKANVTLPAGEHILRMTVTGSWFDIDYFNFAKLVCAVLISACRPKPKITVSST